MVKTKTVGWAVFGLFAIWCLLGSGKGIEYTKNIFRMPERFSYQRQLYKQEQQQFPGNVVAGNGIRYTLNGVEYERKNGGWGIK